MPSINIQGSKFKHPVTHPNKHRNKTWSKIKVVFVYACLCPHKSFFMNAFEYFMRRKIFPQTTFLPSFFCLGSKFD